MNHYKFIQSFPAVLLPYADQMNFSYHINSFDYPTMHSHADYWEFTIVLNGSMNNYSKGKTLYPTGSVLISTTRDSHFILNASKSPLQYVNLIVREDYVINVLKLIAPTVLEEILSRNTQFFLSRKTQKEIETILLSVQLDVPERIAENEALLCSAFLLLISSLITSTISYPLETNQWIANLNKIIRENDYLSFTVNDLCKMLGYSRTQLNLLFKKHFGTTPHDYLLRLRFEHATYLLFDSNLSISDISLKLGYANPAAFYTAFKK